MTNAARTIYIIVGKCGEYSDRDKWIVAAYRDEGEAFEHARKANAAVAEWLKVEDHFGDTNRNGFKPFTYDTVCGLSEYDADSQRYSFQAVLLLSEVP